MQSFQWYLRRLKSMSPAEIVWRVQGLARDKADHLVYKNRLPDFKASSLINGYIAETLDARAVGDHVQELAVGALSDYDPTWRDALLTKAEKAIEGRLSYFDLVDVDHGQPIHWNHEQKANRKTPTGFVGKIDYRDHASTGDCKFVWEPNRHHQLVVLARAYRATGEVKFAQAVLDQLNSWMDQCPFGTTMNWRSPLELGIRVINWVWALELIKPSGLLTEDKLDRIAGSAYRHMWDIARKFSKYSSANNHLIGEAAGVYVGACYFAGFPESERWRRQAQEILINEIIEQTHEDGGTREQAFGYHLFVLQFYLASLLAARSRGEDFPPPFYTRLEKMFEFVAILIEGGQQSPQFGDADDGYVLDLGGSPASARSLLGVGAILFNRGEFRDIAGQASEWAYWFIGPESTNKFHGIPKIEEPRSLASTSLSQTGYYLLQAGKSDARNAISAIIDCGPLGFKSIAAHGHADALSMTLRVGGFDVLVDPGTYDYFTHPEYRAYFRSTKAHNTVEIDGQDQSRMQGLFLWGTRAVSRCVEWRPTDNGGVFIGEHFGYRRLSDPVTHRRTVELHADRRELVIHDDIVAAGKHQIVLYWHFGENCTLKSETNHIWAVDYQAGLGTIHVDDGCHVSPSWGSQDPIMGWVSRGYHRKEAITTLVAQRECIGRTRITTRILVGQSAPDHDGAESASVASVANEG